MYVILSGGASLTYTVEVTPNKLDGSETLVWFPITGLTALTANGKGNLAFGATAIRLNVTIFASGTATLKAIAAN